MGLKFKSLLLSIIIFIFAFVMKVAAQEKTPDSAKRLPYGKTGWSTFIRGGYLHQFKTDIDNSSEFSVNRVFVQGGVSYSPEVGRSVSLAVGYGYDGYDFSGSGGFGALDPWSEINSLRISAPVRWGFDDKWTLFAIPTVRTTVQNGADLDDGIQGGGFAGFSYRFSDRLTLGPGFGAITQIEDSTSVFPVLLIDWEIIDRLSLRTGGGTGATLGPGLELAWEASDNWSLSLGGRLERLRFRLDDKNISPGGVGEDRSFPIYAGINYIRGRRLGLSLVGGVDVGGELIIENKDGSEISSEYYDPAPFLGFAFSFRF